ncbi:Vacuolar protein sorting-associated protein 37A [Balamuthia mandrillaris]
MEGKQPSFGMMGPPPPYPGGGAGGVAAATPSSSKPSSKEGGSPLRPNLPPVPNAFPEVQRLSNAQVQNLLKDEQAFLAYADNLPFFKQLYKIRDDLRDTNAQLAEQNIGSEAELSDLRREVFALQESVKEKRAVLEQKVLQQQQIMSRFSVPSLIQKLEEEAAQTEGESDQLAHQFLEGSLSAEDFTKAFLEKRQQHHLQKAKSEYLRVHNPSN